MKTSFFKIEFLSIALALATVSCANDDNSITPETIVQNGLGNENISLASKTTFIANYAKIAAANYSDSYNTAIYMQTKINAFLTTPTDVSLKEARDSWLYARNFYGQTEAFREANGPIDNENLLGTEGKINAWPLDEGYIDYVSDNQGGRLQRGLIGNTSFELTEENLINNNETPEDNSISIGWHAIEFLLWGQDLNYNPITHATDNYTAAGNRPFTDYITSATTPNANRRKTYLQIITNLLVKDLKDLKDTWSKGGSYRTTFETLEEDVALTNILNGIGFISNGEIALERLDPAIEEDQENEHSCFSDNTNQDMWANVNGINNVITGGYTRENGIKIKGTSLIALVANTNNNYTIAVDLINKATQTLNKLEALTTSNKTFDEIISQESLGSNGVAGQLSSALKKQGISIAETAKALGISITIN